MRRYGFCHSPGDIWARGAGDTRKGARVCGSLCENRQENNKIESSNERDLIHCYNFEDLLKGQGKEH